MIIMPKLLQHPSQLHSIPDVSAYIATQQKTQRVCKGSFGHPLPQSVNQPSHMSFHSAMPQLLAHSRLETCSAI